MRKVCIKCGIEKDISEFYKDFAMADGHLNTCKECVKKRMLVYRKANIEKIREYDRVRGRSEKRRNKQRAYINKLKNSNPQKYQKMRNEITQRYREKHPEKWNAHQMVKDAIKTGKLIPHPCEVCGNTKVIAHHDNYNFPLSVRWFCEEHHKALHTAINDRNRKEKAG